MYRRRGPSALHRFDPRAKILLLAAFLVLFFLPLAVWHLALYLAALLALCILFLGIGNTLRPIRLILPILILVLLLTPPFHREGAALIAVRETVLVSVPGLLLALRLIVRFTGITVVFHTFVGTTDPDELILALRGFGIPFSVCLVLSITLQYIPTIRAFYDQVQDAHRLRLASEERRGAAAPARRPGLFRRLRKTIPALTSVLILSVRRIPTLAMALESRGVGRKNRRSAYHRLRSGAPLILQMITALLIAALIAITAVMFP